MAEKHGKQLKVGVAYQSAWASPKGITDTYKLMPYDVGSVSVEPGVLIEQLNYYQSAGIMDAKNRSTIDFTTDLHRIRFSGVVELTRLAPHLAGAFQSVTESASVDTYDKDFTPADTVLDFSNDDGVLHTIAVSHIAASDGVILENALIDELTLSVDNTASGIGQVMQMSGTWVGNEMNTEQNLSGATFSALPSTFVLLTDHTNTNNATWTLNMTIGEDTFSDVCWRRFECRINNNVTSDCKKTNGKPGNYRIAPEIMYTIDIPYNDSTYTVFRDYQQGSNVAFDFGNGAATSTVGQIKFDGENGIITENPNVYDGDYLAVRVTFKALRPSAGWNAAYVGFVDGVDWTY